MFRPRVSIFLFVYEAVTQVQFLSQTARCCSCSFKRETSVRTASIRTLSSLRENFAFSLSFLCLLWLWHKPIFSCYVTGAAAIWRNKGAGCLNLLNLMAPCLRRRIISPMWVRLAETDRIAVANDEQCLVLKAAFVNQVPCSVILAREMSKVLLSVRTDRDESSFGNFSSVIREPQKRFFATWMAWNCRGWLAT